MIILISKILSSLFLPSVVTAGSALFPFLFCCFVALFPMELCLWEFTEAWIDCESLQEDLYFLLSGSCKSTTNLGSFTELNSRLDFYFCWPTQECEFRLQKAKEMAYGSMFASEISPVTGSEIVHCHCNVLGLEF